MSPQKEQISQISDAPGSCTSSTQPVGHEATTERRACARYPASFAVGISTTTRRTSIGVTQDISQSGACLLTRSHFSVGDRLRLEIRLLQGKSQAHMVGVRVVRAIPLGLESNGLWRSRVAVQFDESLDGMDGHLLQVAEAQAKQWRPVSSMSPKE